MNLFDTHAHMDDKAFDADRRNCSGRCRSRALPC